MNNPENIDLQQELKELIKTHERLTEELNFYKPWGDHLNIVCATRVLGKTDCKNYSCTPRWKVTIDLMRYVCWGCKSKGWKLTGFGKRMEVNKT